MEHLSSQGPVTQGSADAEAIRSAPESSSRDRLDQALAELDIARCPDVRRRLEAEVFALTSHLAEQAAGRYRGRGVEYEDLRQVCCLALLNAIRRYRPDQGVSFAAFARPTISGELKHYFRDHGWCVRPPRRLQEGWLAVASQQEVLRQTLHREPSLVELSTGVGMPSDEVREVLVASGGYRATSLDGTPARDDAPPELPDPADAYTVVDEREVLRWAIRGLPAADREVLRLRFVEELTQAEIGQRIGVSQMQVSRILRSLCGRLRGRIDAEAAVA